MGDDAYGEDPTVNELQEEYAGMVGKEAALFVPSGTMANQLALRVLSEPATSVVVGARQHIVLFEAGAAGMNVPVQFDLLDDSGGSLPVEGVRAAAETPEYYRPRSSLVCIENTHMAAGGVPWDLDHLAAVSRAAGPLPIHMDGARLFNASVATSTPPEAYAAHATTVMSCLSKGLCAPVGSVLAGPADFVAAARSERRRLGGGMRQAGVIAAAGLVALRTMVQRLEQDHARARVLAEAVAARWPGCGCEPAQVVTNIVVFRHPRPAVLLEHLRREGVLGGTVAVGTIRLVAHHDVDEHGVERAVKAIAQAP